MSGPETHATKTASSPRLKVRAMGPLVVELDGDRIVFPSTRSEMVVAYLALKRGGPVLRREIAAAIWPGVEDSKRNTSLRVALHGVRQVLGPSLLEISRLSIGFVASRVDLDLIELDKIRAEASEALNEKDRIEALWKEWVASERILLEGMNTVWAESARVSHADRVVSLGYELFDLLEDTKDFSRAERVIRVLTKNDPEDLEAFEHALRMELNLGGMSAASKLLRESGINTHRTDLPRSLRRLVQSIRMGLSERVGKPERLSREQTMLLGKMFDANISRQSDEALKLLAREASDTANWTHPRTLLSLCLASLEGSQFRTGPEIDLGITACFLTAYTSDPTTGIELGKQLLATLHEDDPRRVRVQSILGFNEFELGDYDRARAFHEAALHNAERLGLQAQLPRVRNRYGVLCMHASQFDEAQAHFETALKLLGKNLEGDAVITRASILANLCHLECFRKNWTRAVRWGKIVAADSGDGARVFQTTMAAYYGFALLMTNRRQEGINWIVRGLEFTAQEGMKRMNCVALDFTVLAFIQLGLISEAQTTLVHADWVRDSIGVKRAPAEVALMARIRADLSHHLPQDSQEPTTRSPGLFSVARWAIQQLQQAR